MQVSGFFPAELTADIPRITLTGCESLSIEQHKGLVLYQTDEITFRTGSGLLRIVGNEMQIRFYTAREATITGKIISASFSSQTGR